MTGITVTRAAGRLLASKPGHDPEGEARRRHEAAVLSAIDHPGVVPFVDLREGPPVEIRIGFVGPDTWATRRPRDPDSVVAALAAVAATVADLHDLGLTHRALSPDHVLIASDGRPVLCGFADAGPADDTACLIDLGGLAGLAEHLSGDLPASLAEPLGDLSRRTAAGSLTARALVAELDGLKSRPATARSRALPRLSMPTRPLVLVGAVVVAVAGAAWWLGRAPRAGGDAVAIETPPTVPTPTTSAAIPTTSTTTAAPLPTTTVPVHEPGPAVIEHDGRRYGVAGADVAILGDWTCDAVITPAVLDTGSGVVAVFGGWPEPDGSLGPILTTIVEDASGLRVDPAAPCGRLRVVHHDGSTLVTVAQP